MEQMVRTHNEFKVVRKSISEYQGPKFKKEEKEHLEIIPEVKYYLEDTYKEDDDSSLILITSSQTDISQFSKEELKQTKLLVHPNSGHDNLTKDFVDSIDFPIIVGNSIRAHAVTNFIMSALFKHFSNFEHQDEWDKSRKWERSLLISKKVLLIGYGHIGKLVEKSLSPLVASIDIYDPDKGYKELSNSDKDIVIVAASLNPTSEGLIDKVFLKKLAKDFLLINPARGKIVKQLDLMEVLARNKRATAYLDVFEQEPYNAVDFAGIKNIIRTSHIAGVYSSLSNEMLKFEFEIINEFVRDLDNNLVNFNEKYKDLLLKNRIRENYIL